MLSLAVINAPIEITVAFVPTKDNVRQTLVESHDAHESIKILLKLSNAESCLCISGIIIARQKGTSSNIILQLFSLKLCLLGLNLLKK